MKTAAAPQPITEANTPNPNNFVEDHVLGHVVSGTM